MRMVWVPRAPNITYGLWPVQYPVSTQPHPESPQPLHCSRFTSSASLVPIRYAADPLVFTASENWTQTESFHFESPVARTLSQRRYVVYDGAVKFASK